MPQNTCECRGESVLYQKMNPDSPLTQLLAYQLRSVSSDIIYETVQTAYCPMKALSYLSRKTA